MNLNLSEEQVMLRESAGRFLAATHDAGQSRDRIPRGAGLDRAMWARYADLGWLGLPFAEEEGGIGGGPADIAILTEQMGAAAVAEPYVDIVVLAGGLIAALGDAGQRAAFLAPLIAGKLVPVLAHLEDGAKGRIDHVITQAVPAGDGWALSGRKILVPAGMEADVLLVSARLGDDIGLFALPTEAAGITRSGVPTLDGGIAADIALDGAIATTLLAPDALGTIEAVIDLAISAACADAVGVMDALLAATVKHCKGRVQFGKPLSEFQALQHRMADMAVKCEEARASALLAALSAGATPALRIRGVSGAKARIGRIARHVAHEAIQLHGAVGFSEEMPLGTWFRRLYAFEHRYGSTSDHLQRYAHVALTPTLRDAGLLREPGAV